MAVPKRKHSTARKGKRRAAIKLKKPHLILCPHCQKPKKNHQICPHCGSYKEKLPQAEDQKTPQK